VARSISQRGRKGSQEIQKNSCREVLFHQYVQWLIDTQMKALYLEAQGLQMDIGLYYDLAVGSVGGGSDAWSYKEVMAHEANVGAPPDDFSPDGQEWGFPPLIPEKLRESGYELFHPDDSKEYEVRRCNQDRPCPWPVQNFLDP